MLELEGLRRRYGHVTALDDLSFEVPSGEVVGFLGPNGAGKTTTMRAIFGLTDLEAGSVRWNGAKVDQAARRRFGYMPEERGLYPGMRVGEQLEYLGRLHGLSTTDAVHATQVWLERLEIADRRDSKVETLSHGNQQRVQLAAALLHQPELLVLDEPLSGLDPAGIDAIGRVLVDEARAGSCVVFSSHQLDQVEDLCERVTIIDHGRLVVSRDGGRPRVERRTPSGGAHRGRSQRDLGAAPARRGGIRGERRRRPPRARELGRQRRCPSRRDGRRTGHGVLLRAPPAIRSLPGSGVMKYVAIALVVIAVGVVRVAIFLARRHRRAERSLEPSPGASDVASTAPAPADTSASSPQERSGARRAADIGGHFGDVGMIAMREITERVRSRFFRVGTLLVLIAVAAAIIIPTLHKSSSGPTPQVIGVVGGLSPDLKNLVAAAGVAQKDKVRFVPEESIAETKAALHAGRLDFAIIDSSEVLLWEPAALASSPADPTLVNDTAEYLGVLKAYRTARLSPAQAADVDNSKSVPVLALQSGPASSTRTAPVIGIVLLFVMLTQYCTWILIGVMQEKSSRVVEVLLATVRPIQLLGGKVLGIGLVALGQATLVVAFALLLAKGVGSDLLKGDQPLALAAELCWLVLGYAFYCWVYAAAGSTAERQDQIQTLALPLSIPILIGYVFSLTVASSGNPNTFFKVLAYLPPTAPFCMSVLVGLGDATWWEFVTSVLIAIASTAGMAVLAARIYRRAVLRTGGRVHLRELLTHSG